MAASKAPKHDFAPAWLKIPEDKSQKPAGSKSSEHKEKSSHRRKDFPFDYPYGGMVPRQRSFDHYFDDRSFPGHKFRQHSLDEEYYENAAAYYNGYYNGYPAGPFRHGPGNFRDPKYSNHNGLNNRFGHINGAYPAYCDPYGYDFYPDRFTNTGRIPNGGMSRQKFHHKGDKEGRGGHSQQSGKSINSDKDQAKEDIGDDTEKPVLEEEFPSLNGEAESKKKDDVAEKNKVSSGVWDKNSREKILQQNKEPENNQVNSYQKLDNCNKDIKHSHNYIYKALVPNKNKVTKRNTKDNAKSGPISKDINSNTSPFSKHNKENTIESSPTPPIDILNTRLVTTPKNLSDKKSDFLKALKQDNDLNSAGGDIGAKLIESKQDLAKSNRNHVNKADEKGDNIANNSLSVLLPVKNASGFVNGFKELSLENEDCLDMDRDDFKDSSMVALSSSLEAEQRLLREMGWSEDDEENPPITEEEMREIQQLSKQIKQLKEREQKNGLKRSLPKTWSPQHIPMYSPASLSQQLNSTVSSDSDSDSDQE